MSSAAAKWYKRNEQQEQQVQLDLLDHKEQQEQQVQQDQLEQQEGQDRVWLELQEPQVKQGQQDLKVHPRI